MKSSAPWSARKNHSASYTVAFTALLNMRNFCKKTRVHRLQGCIFFFFSTSGQKYTLLFYIKFVFFMLLKASGLFKKSRMIHCHLLNIWRKDLNAEGFYWNVFRYEITFFSWNGHKVRNMRNQLWKSSYCKPKFIHRNFIHTLK